MQVLGLVRRLFRRSNSVPTQGLKRKPYVVARHGLGEVWTKDEQKWLRLILESDPWKKLMRFADDAIVMDVLGVAEDEDDVVDPEWVKAMVVGRKRQMEYQYIMAGITKYPGLIDQERDDLPKMSKDRDQIQSDE